MKNKDKKDSKLKTFYKNFKSAWAIPQKRAGIKLLAYFIFFIIFFLIAGIVNRISDTSKIYNENTTTTTKILKEDKYKDKQDKLINNKHNVNIVINVNNIEYKINGILENNLINGYLESNDTIKKVLIENNTLYEIKNNENIKLDLDINYNLLNIDYIIDLIKNTKTIIERNENSIIYYYTIQIDGYDNNIKIYTNENDIYRIDIFNDSSKYELNFDN